MNKLASIAVFPILLFALSWPSESAFAKEPTPLDQRGFAELHALIKPQSGESRWMEIDWHPNVWEARQLAAQEGKPIFLMAGSGGAPAAGC
jgi:hypothetical protein